MRGKGIFWRTSLAVCQRLALMLALAYKAEATGINYEFGTVFSGQSTPPAAAPPWVEATFLDVTPGTVQLTVTNVGLSSGEFMSGLYFNINPADNVNNLKFSEVSSAGSFTAPMISLGEDSFKADGDGKYDILLSFGTSNGTTFTTDNSITYTITGIASLSSSDFGYQSTPAGGAGPFYAAAHIQGTPPNNGQSCWIEPDKGPLPVPEPSPKLLLALLAGLFFAARRWQDRTVKSPTRA